MLEGGYFHFLSRISPFIIPLYALLYGLLHSNYRAYLFFVGAIISDLLNFGLKQIIYPLCSSKLYPYSLFGSCARPLKKGSSGCSVFKEPYILSMITKGNSYGMQSGHAQFAAFTAIKIIQLINPI